MPHLVQISAFYQNNKTTGVGLTLTEDVGDLDDILTTIQNAYKAMWEEAQSEGTLPALIHELRLQLGIIGSTKENLDFEHATIVIGNVWLLESHGQMITDEFNGLQLAYFTS